ncbi:hypothetical protein X975_19331, partial [Stegodyphus mimosarum]
MIYDSIGSFSGVRNSESKYSRHVSTSRVSCKRNRCRFCHLKTNFVFRETRILLSPSASSWPFYHIADAFHES